MKRPLDIINKLLLYGLFVLGAILLITGIGRTSTMVFAFEMFIASIASAWILKLKEVPRAQWYWFWINLGLWTNILGELYFYYMTSFPYDKVLHVGLGIVLAAIVFEYYQHNSKLKKDSVFLAVLGMLALWEIYEYFLDTFFHTQLQGVIVNGVWLQTPMQDTMYDLIMGSIGAITYLILKKEKVNTIIKKELKKINKLNKKGSSPFLILKEILYW